MSNLTKLNQDLNNLSTLIRQLGEPGQLILQKARTISNKKKRFDYLKVSVKELKKQIKAQEKYKEAPVDITTFLFSPDYLGLERYRPETDEDEGCESGMYEEVEKSITEIVNGDYVEAVLTGGIGTAKTTIALYVLAYTLYMVSVLKDPHKEYGIQRTDELVFIFQSLNATHAKTVDYARFKALIDNSKYFQEKFPYDKQVESELQFPNRIYVKPVSGSSTAAIGQNVFGGMLDEVNFMAVTERSKNSREKGTYDQAWENYNSLVRRRKSRFMKRGKLPGLFCLVSSKRYPGEFTDVKIEEARKNKLIYVYDKREWDIKPVDQYSGEWFKVFIGDLTRKPYILKKHDNVPESDQHLLMEIPEEYRSDFELDILAALRDIAGVSTMALEPFIMDVEKVASCFGSIDSILSSGDCDFNNSRVDIYPRRVKDRDEPRFIHVDIALSGDSLGIACGYVPGFTTVKRADDHIELLPEVKFDFVLEVKPPQNGEIDLSNIRKLIYRLKDAGMWVKWVSFDSFQSADSLQVLSKKGYQVGLQSVDRTPKPYYITKSALMDRRVHIPDHTKSYIEFVSLERDPKSGKIDHPAHGSKDCSDAIAGVVYGLTMRREVWIRHGISLRQIPESVVSMVQQTAKSVDNYGSVG